MGRLAGGFSAEAMQRAGRRRTAAANMGKIDPNLDPKPDMANLWREVLGGADGLMRRD